MHRQPRLSQIRNETVNESERLREELAQKIAGYIVDHGLDWTSARARAAEDFGDRHILRSNVMPSSEQIETAVRAHFDLFAPEAHRRTLHLKRTLALHILKLLKGFSAYLTGAVLNGAATEDSPVCIEVFTDDIKAILSVLMDEGFDIEALDPASSAFARATESVGFIIAWQQIPQIVRIDILEPQQRFHNPARRNHDIYQAEWEASGRISIENLQKVIEN